MWAHIQRRVLARVELADFGSLISTVLGFS